MNRKPKIRIATQKDAAALLEIYRPYVEDTAISFEYNVPTILEFQKRIETTIEKYPYLVLEEPSGAICGYTYASAFKEREAYDWSVETTIYIAKNCRGKGYGKQLYEKLEQILSCQNILNANACIAVAKSGNTHLDNSSWKFHEKMGYTLVGTFHDSGYKFSQWYDMIWMEKMLGEHTKATASFLPFAELRSHLR